MTDLEVALPKVRRLETLALAHVTVSRWLRPMIKSRSLIPRPCGVFGRDLVYLSYGVPHYRPSNDQTEDEMLLPVALVFERKLLAKIERVYPFDTGAVASGVFGIDWQSKLGDLERFYVSHGPERLVSAFYGSNGNYLKGRVGRAVPTGGILRLLHDFLSQDLSSAGIDERQRTIECIGAEPIPFDPMLRWIGYPKHMAREVQKLRRSATFVSDPYDPCVRFSPGAIVQQTLAPLVSRRLYLGN